jgi:hypothetical protein
MSEKLQSLYLKYIEFEDKHLLFSRGGRVKELAKWFTYFAIIQAALYVICNYLLFYHSCSSKYKISK